MRLGFLVIALAACSPASTRPAWPKSTDHEVDGGESLAPRAAARSSAASEADDDDGPSAPATAGAAGGERAAPPGASLDRGSPANPSAPSPDEPVQAEDIVIEIDD
jgi:hypothetical protein